MDFLSGRGGGQALILNGFFVLSNYNPLASAEEQKPSIFLKFVIEDVKRSIFSEPFEVRTNLKRN